MGRPKNTAARRAQIVAALVAVMSERGYERASIAEVARRAGLTSGLVHYHFKSKQEILLQAVATLEREQAERIDARLLGVDDPRERLLTCVDAYLARDAAAEPAAVACWVAISAEAIRQPEVGAAFQAVLVQTLERLSDLIGAARRAEGQPARGARSAAAALLAAIQGYYVVAAAAPDLVPSGSAAPNVRRLAEALLHG